MPQRFADADGRLRATFEIAWLSGWAPHESQQKPLKPGSAAQRLADALGTREIPAGEKPRPMDAAIVSFKPVGRRSDTCPCSRRCPGR